MKHRTLTRLALPAAALSVLAGLAPAATAAPAGSVGTVVGASGAGSGGDAIAAHEMGLSEGLVDRAGRTSSARALRDYWTPARMRAAQPVEAPSYTPADLRAAAEEVEPTPLREVTQPAPAPTRRATPPFSYVAGKVFFSNSDGDFICSAAAINSKSKSIVSTAGHCLHGGGADGEWASNWVFVPGYNRGKKPKGMFAATDGFAMQDWVDNGASPTGFNRDFAFARLGRNAKRQTVVGAVGGNGLTVGGAYRLDLRIFGYPGNIANGEVQKTCAKKSQKVDWEGFSFRAVAGCGFGGGSSGGPWVTGYNARTDVGQLRGITSFGPADNSFIATPYFDKNVPNLLKAADAG
ncbi:serine protease [Nocardioides sp. CFH 31398]|uniref:trypsin-like serine peptidase n=1 Tax=Nocardioides sp. CFH 31398 TaxID=2919579 RepID=UPI001F063598|nr:hypothetical protein [Nocardioides sp. CFH 31398]MCH1866016.1 hypothetical protein [Nocardioides sp. CFH 31398]